MKMLSIVVLFLQLLPLAPGELNAAIVQKLPWCAEGAGYDSDKNGILDGQEIPVGATACTTAGTGAANFATEGTGYAVKAESGILAGTLAAFTDATADNSSAIRIPAGAGNNFLSGQARYITPTLGAGDHYAWVRMRAPDPGATTIWMSTSPMLLIPSPSSSLQTSVGAQTLTYNWVKLSNVVAGGARREVYITTQPGVEVDCIYLDTLANPPPSSIRCPGGTSAAGAEYVMLRTTGTPASCSDVSTANPVPFTGFSNWNNTVVTAKMVWKDTGPPDRIYGCIKVNDSNLNAATTGADNSALLGNNNDYFELVIKSNIDNLDDTTKTKIAVNINATPSIADIRFTAANGSDFTYAANCSVVRTIVGDLDAVADDTSWEIFFACDLNANDIAQSQMGKMNLLIRDNDGVTGIGTKALAKGGEFDINLASSMMTVLFDSNTIPPPADGTAPTVGAPTLLVNAQTQQTWRFTCTDAGSGCASGVLDWDINSGTPYANSTVATLAGGNYDVTITGLTANTPYFVRGRACDAAGNCTNGAEANALTSPSTVTAFVSTVAAGTGNCSTLANACLMATALTAAVPGSRIQVLGGTTTVPRNYTGATSMIAPPSGKSGTQAAPITVFCSVPGGCLFDGNNVRVPIHLNGNNWFILEDLNAANSSEGVVQNVGQSSNNIVRRVVAWNASDTGNFQVWLHSSGSNNLWEDVAAFGNGRYMYITYGPNTHSVTIRRAWGAWMHSLHTSPKNVFGLDYSVHQPGTTCENCIGTWITTQTGISQPASIFRIIGGDPSEGGDTDSRYFGSIAYYPATLTYQLPALAMVTTSTMTIYKDVVFYNERTDTRNLNMKNPTTVVNPNCVLCELTNITEIGGAADTVESQWVQTNRGQYASIAAMNAASANPFQTTSGNGARVCFRYVNKTLTSTKLWPWPMNQRIIDAMVQAGKPTVDVTATMRNIFGTTAACE